MKLSALKINSARADAGVWVDNIPDMGDLRLKVRDSRNADARRLRTKLVAAVPRNQTVAGRLDPELADAIDGEIMAKTVLVGWENLTGDDDQPIPFSVDAAMKMLLDPDMRPFRDAVAYAAAEVSQVASENAKADVGN